MLALLAVSLVGNPSLRAGELANASSSRSPGVAELKLNSPRFRGWDGGGMVAGKFPMAWNSLTGEGIAWKSPVPAPGYNSPVVWGDHLFISGGTAEKREVYSYQSKTGELLWRRAIDSLVKLPDAADSTLIAASTTATDGRRLYVIFANGDIAALNFDGGLVWSTTLGPLKDDFGHASSLAIWHDTLIVQLDQGEHGSTDSKLVAVDCATGRVRWKQSRPVPVSWATPIVFEAAGKTQILTLGDPWVTAYNFAEGGELWRSGFLENEIVPSPIFAGGLVIAVSPSSKLIALRADGMGDVTKTHVAWTVTNNIPDVASPVSNGKLVFTVSSTGAVTCYDVKNGRELWTHALELRIEASPAIAGNQLFVISEKGVGVVLEVARRFREISRSQLSDKFTASPAFADGRMFLRGQTNLYCIGPAVKPGKGK